MRRLSLETVGLAWGYIAARELRRVSIKLEKVEVREACIIIEARIRGKDTGRKDKVVGTEDTHHPVLVELEE